MAKDTAQCYCIECGAHFERIVTGFNRRDCDEKRKWAESHYTLCSDCYKKKMQEQRQKELDDMRLPELQGTPKQIAYANKLRAKFALRWKSTLDIVREWIEESQQPEFVDRPDVLDACAGTPKEEIPMMMLRNATKEAGYERELTVLTSTFAAEIIELLK